MLPPSSAAAAEAAAAATLALVAKVGFPFPRLAQCSWKV